MAYFVSITSQGQISIPAKLRKELSLNKNQQVFMKREGNRIVIEPPVDIASLKGVFHRYALKGKSIDEIRALEKTAWEKAAIARYRIKTL